MKHLAKDVYLRRDGDWSFELMRKKITQTGDNKGKSYYDTIGYYSNMDRVVSKLKDMGYWEWVNGDISSCREFINEACASINKMK